MNRTPRPSAAVVRIPALALAVISALASPLIHAGGTDAGAKMALGRKVFTETAQPPCRTCHSLKDIKAVAEIGAKLEELQPDADRVARAVREGVGVMPSFAGKLTGEQIEAVAHFVARTAGGAK